MSIYFQPYFDPALMNHEHKLECNVPCFEIKGMHVNLLRKIIAYISQCMYRLCMDMIVMMRTRGRGIFLMTHRLIVDWLSRNHVA